jgi:hypothetical protein
MLDVAAQQEEILRANRSLEYHLPAAARVSALAYPFGAYDANTCEAVAVCGMHVALSIGGATECDIVLQLARTPVGHASVARLFADLEIVEPAKASLRRIVARLARPPLERGRQRQSASAERRVPDAPQV